jgi:hypothetical protein
MWIVGFGLAAPGPSVNLEDTGSPEGSTREPEELEEGCGDEITPDVGLAPGWMIFEGPEDGVFGSPPSKGDGFGGSA